MMPAIVRLPRADSAALQVWLGRTAAITAFLLALLLGDRLAVLAWDSVPVPQLPSPQGGASVETVVGERPSEGVAYQRIAGWHLFGKVAKAPPPPPEVPKEVPEEVPATQLRLSLRGVFHYPDVDRQRAIIASPDGKEDVYTVGDALPGGATLEDIGAQRVVLSRQGRLEALSFPEDGLAGALGSRSQGFGAPSAETTTLIDAVSMAQRYRETMQSDPTALADIAQVQPYIEAGNFRGFRLRPGRQPNLLRQLGLRPGDVVTSVDGVPLDSMAQAMESMTSMVESDQVDVTILRNGRQIPYTFRLN